MRELAWWIEWPAGIVRVGVVFLVATTLAVVLVDYPGLLRDLGAHASDNSALSFSDREIAGGNGLVADQEAVYAARALIPEDETFDVVVSPEYEGGIELTVPYVAGYYRYFLLPRRMAEGARWIVCYACDLAGYGERAEVVWTGSDISIVRVTS